MKSVLIAPRKYVQGRGVLGEIGFYAALLGKKPAVLWDTVVRDLVGQAVSESMRQAGLAASEVEFGGESTRQEAARVAEILQQQGADVCVGVGGGKTLDCAKAAAQQAGAKLLIAPTVAS
ncbi:MAG: iron-containing alcohol dehydrogenase, partial [Pirellulaceae bacterium]|nr:iron-containing alcohol dehydrogenase [Pirellulaceae bacterium]